MDINALKVDSTRSANGDWIGNIPGMGDLRLKVRGFSSPAYRAAVSLEASKVPREKRMNGDIDGSILPDVMDKLTGRCMAALILMDWEGLNDGDTPMPFDPEKAIIFLTHPDYRYFRDAVIYAASAVEKIEANRTASVQGN